MDIKNENNSRYTAFAPLAGKSPRCLILGTFPSPLSRARGEYYGNRQNAFWRIMFDMLGSAVPLETALYEDKKKLVLEHGIAVWDVIESCEIKGADDKNIREPVYNTALPEFIIHAGIKVVFFNGANAYRFYTKGIGEIEKRVLPSTSPANARYGYAVKLERWSGALLPFINPE